MSSWGNQDQANNAPKEKNIISNSSARGNVVFANTTVGAFASNTSIGLYGVNVNTAVSNAGKMAGPGWVLEKRYTGPISSFSITNAGSTYTNSDVVTVSGGKVNATANVVTNGTGNVVSLSFTANGGGFVNNSVATLSVNTSGGTGLTVSFVMGGRANRKTFETLVAMGSISGNTYVPV
jgi:hypothetical protein